MLGWLEEGRNLTRCGLSWSWLRGTCGRSSGSRRMCGGSSGCRSLCWLHKWTTGVKVIEDIPEFILKVELVMDLGCPAGTAMLGRLEVVWSNCGSQIYVLRSWLLLSWLCLLCWLPWWCPSGRCSGGGGLGRSWSSLLYLTSVKEGWHRESLFINCLWSLLYSRFNSS